MISNQVALTAASCVDCYLIGTTITNNFSDNVNPVEEKIKLIRIHENYSEPGDDYDLAIIIFEEPVNNFKLDDTDTNTAIKAIP